MCNTEVSIDTRLQDSLNTWALQNNCACVDLESDREMKRIWIFCISVALFSCLCITLMMVWTDQGQQEDLYFGDDENPAAAGSSDAKREEREARELEKEIEEEDAQEGPAPNLEAAKLHLKRTSPTKDLKWRPIWGTSCSTFSEIGGVGTELYFRFLKRLGLTFFYMSALTCIAATFNSVSTFAADNGQYLAKTGIGNIGSNVAGAAVTPDKRYIVLKGEAGCEGHPVTQMTEIIAWLDTAAILIFIISIAHFRFSIVPRTKEESDLTDTTVKDFGVEIDFLPRKYEGMEEDVDGKCRYEAELNEFLVERMNHMRKKFPEPALDATGPPRVREMVLVRDYGGRLAQIKRKAELIKDTEVETYCENHKKVLKLKKEFEKLSSLLDRKLGNKEKLPVIRAYAIVNTQQDATNLWTDFRFSQYALMRWSQDCMSKCGCLERCFLFRKRFFKDRPIRIREPPEPSNIIWENQDLPWKSRLLRVGIINIVFVAIVLVSFGLVYAASASSKSQMKSNNQLLGDDTCDPVVANILPVGGQKEAYKCYVANATRWTEEYLNDGASKDEIGCWCGTMGYQKITSKPSLVAGRCSGWLVGIAKGIGVGALATIIVVVINVSAKGILLWLAEEEKPLSITELNSSKMVKIWALQALNTGAVIFCVNFSPPKGMPFGFIFLGEYGDSVRGWYTVVGAALLMNMLANAFTPGTTELVMMIVNKFSRCWASRGGKVKHHKHLLQLYENPDFDIAAKLAQLLTTVFVCVTYSAGLPMLNFFAALYMFYTYWCDKISLLWGSKRPPAFDTKLASDAAQFMMYATGLHCFFAIWMFGQPCTFPSKPLGGKLAMLASYETLLQASVGNMTQAGTGAFTNTSSSEGYSAAFGFRDRISLESTWMLTVMLVIAVALWVLWTIMWILGGTVGHFWTFIKLAIFSGKKSQVSPNEDVELRKQDQWTYAKDLIKNVCPPASYKIKHHPSFRHVKAEFERTGFDGRPATGYPATPDVSPTKPKTKPVKGPPVQPEIAVGFLKALKTEYLDLGDQAVGKFFEAANVAAADQEMLTTFEHVVRGAVPLGAEEVTTAIEEIAQKWELPPPS